MAIHAIQQQHFSTWSQQGRTDSFSQLPNEMIHQVFDYLSAVELAKSCVVCKSWKQLASDYVNLWKAIDLRKMFPFLKVIDKPDWVAHVDMSKYGLSIEDALSSPLDKRQAIPILKRCFSLPIEGNAGVTLLPIPKGLTINKVLDLAGNRWAYVTSDLGNIPVDRTYWIVITNGIFENSRNRSVIDQIDLVKKLGFEKPKILEATTLLTMTFLTSGERLYSNWTFTRCLDHDTFDWDSGPPCEVVVGCFDEHGWNLWYSDHDEDGYGVGGVFRI